MNSQKCHLDLSNGPAVFQQTMQNMLGEMLVDFLMVYIDVIVMYSFTEDERVERLQWEFDALEKYWLKLKPSR